VGLAEDKPLLQGRLSFVDFAAGLHDISVQIDSEMI
jgi:hypothetical protein